MKTPLLESLLNKVADFQACNFIKKRLQCRCFSCEYCENFKNSFFVEHLWWLLLKLYALHFGTSLREPNIVKQVKIPLGHENNISQEVFVETMFRE